MTTPSLSAVSSTSVTFRRPLVVLARFFSAACSPAAASSEHRPLSPRRITRKPQPLTDTWRTGSGHRRHESGRPAGPAGHSGGLRVVLVTEGSAYAAIRRAGLSGRNVRAVAGELGRHRSLLQVPDQHPAAPVRQRRPLAVGADSQQVQRPAGVLRVLPLLPILCLPAVGPAQVLGGHLVRVSPEPELGQPAGGRQQQQPVGRRREGQLAGRRVGRRRQAPHPLQAGPRRAAVQPVQPQLPGRAVGQSAGVCRYGRREERLAAPAAQLQQRGGRLWRTGGRQTSQPQARVGGGHQAGQQRRRQHRAQLPGREGRVRRAQITERAAWWGWWSPKCQLIFHRNCCEISWNIEQ